MYQYACALWISIGKGRAVAIAKVLPEILKGLDHHLEAEIAVYGIFLLAQMVIEHKIVNVKAMHCVLRHIGSPCELVEFNAVKYFMNASSNATEEQRRAIFWATYDVMEEKLRSKNHRVLSAALGLLQNMLVESPFRVACYTKLRPLVSRLKLEDARAKDRQKACLSMLAPSWIPFLTAFLTIIILSFLWRRSRQVLADSSSGTTPSR
jgi:hypothetical protein